MKKYCKWIAILVAILIIAGLVIYFTFFYNKSQNTPSIGTRTSTNMQNGGNYNSSLNSNNDSVSKEIISATEGLEEEIASFSTKITYEDDNRDNNLEITTSKINGTVVKNGDTFSFNEIAGSPTPSEGYEKAGVFVENKIRKDYGGGNCQVSTTIYNAALKVNGIEIIERHSHSREVDYIQKGKDAAVAYGELDLKFKNNTGHDIKVYSETTEKEVKVKIVKLG